MSQENGDQKKTVFVGMPGYMGMTGGASRGFWLASAGIRAPSSTGYHVVNRYNECSLLDANCSGLWCYALNASKQGEPIDYFAMIHSDIQPEDGWLDKLIPEMEANDLDCLSVVVPIKDQHGLTSTALGKPDLNDPWRIFGRITMRELHSLPMTFSAADIGHPDKPLLINTGCFVCRFDWRWAYACKFMSQTRIVYNEEKDIFFAESEPEDWHFARCLAKAGLRVGATRRIRVLHRGHTDFSNCAPWGDYSFDQEYSKQPFLKPVAAVEQFPHDVTGWLSEYEGITLSRLAEGKDVLEVGSYCGRSTICLARTASKVTAVDPFKGEGDGLPFPPRNTFDEFKQNIDRYGVSQRVKAHVGTLEDLPLNGKYDLAFIDGSHDYESVRRDSSLALKRLKVGGVLAFHDYRKYPGQYDGRWDPGVTKAVNELLVAGSELVSTCDSLAIVRPAAELVGSV